jgi:hypothetical protein
LLVRSVAKGLGGSVTPSGALSLLRTAQAALGGTVTAVGALTRRVAHNLAGSAAPAGSLRHLVSKLLSGSVTPSGGLVIGENAQVVIMAAASAVRMVAGATMAAARRRMTPH